MCSCVCRRHLDETIELVPGARRVGQRRTMRVFLGQAPAVWRGSFLVLPKGKPEALEERMDQAMWESFRTPAQGTLAALNREMNLDVAKCRKTCGLALIVVFIAFAAILVASYTSVDEDALTEENAWMLGLLPVFFFAAVAYSHYLAAKAIARRTETGMASLGEICSRATEGAQGVTFSVGKDRSYFVAVTWDGEPHNMPDLRPTKLGKSKHADSGSTDASGAHDQDYHGNTDDFGGFHGGIIQPVGGGGDFSSGGGGFGDGGGDFGGGGDCGGAGGGCAFGGGGGGCD